VPRQVRKCRHCGALNEQTLGKCVECGRALPAEIITIPDPPSAEPQDVSSGPALDAADVPTQDEPLTPPVATAESPVSPPVDATRAGHGDGGAVPLVVQLPVGGGQVGLQQSAFPPAAPSLAAAQSVAGEPPPTPPVPSTTPLGTLAPDAPLFGGFVVEATLHPQAERESGLYRCRDEGGEQRMVKVLGADVVPKGSVWRRLPALDHPNVVKFERTGECEGFYYEVQEFCEDGSLAEAVASGRLVADVGWVRRTFLPQMLEALTYIHGLAPPIVHRDVKEANIYVAADGVLKLGDFDIASELVEAGGQHRTPRVGGTWAYSAPEVIGSPAGDSKQRVMLECDFYSLGVTIVKLLWGETNMEIAHPYGVDLSAAEEFYRSQKSITVPEHLRDGQATPEALRNLLRGLLIRGWNRRWGPEAVGRWLRGETSDADMDAIAVDASNEYIFPKHEPFRYKELEGETFQDFARSMLDHRETAAQGLSDYPGIIGEIESKRGERGATLAHAAGEAWQQVSTQGGSRRLAVYAAALRLCPSLPLVLPDGSEFATYDELCRGFRTRSEADRLALVGDEALETLAIWLAYGGAQLDIKARTVRAIRESEDNPELRLESLETMLLGEPRVLPDGFEVGAPTEYCRHALGDAADWDNDEAPEAYRMALEDWRGRHLEAWLRGMDVIERADESRRQREAGTGPDGIPSEAAFEAVLRQLDPGLPRVTIMLDMTGADGVQEIRRGNTARVVIPYSSSGPGHPFGAWGLLPDTLGAALESHTLDSRTGQVSVSIDAVTGVEPREVSQVELRLRSDNAMIRDPSQAVLRFRVIAPQGGTLALAAAGAVAGAVLLGLPRLAVLLLGGDSPVNPLDYDWGIAWMGALSRTFPYSAFVVGFVALCAAAYAAYRLGAWAWGRY
jgi:serine/threonine protein kinase